MEYFRGHEDKQHPDESLTYSPKDRSAARESQDYGKTIDQSGLVVYKDQTISQERHPHGLSRRDSEKEAAALKSKYAQRKYQRHQQESSNVYSPQQKDSREDASRNGHRGHPSIDNTPARASSPSYLESSVENTAHRDTHIDDGRESRYAESEAKQRDARQPSPPNQRRYDSHKAADPELIETKNMSSFGVNTQVLQMVGTNYTGETSGKKSTRALGIKDFELNEQYGDAKPEPAKTEVPYGSKPSGEGTDSLSIQDIQMLKERQNQLRYSRHEDYG